MLIQKKKVNTPTQATNKLIDYSNQFLESLLMTKTQNLIVCEQSSLAQYLQWTETVLNNQVLFTVLVNKYDLAKVIFNSFFEYTFCCLLLSETRIFPESSVALR